MRHVQRVLDLLDELRDTTASIYYVPDVFVIDLIQSRTGDILGMPVVAMCETPFSGYRGVVKRLMDLCLSSVGLLLLLPFLVVVSILVKLSSPGPVIFKQRRYGLDGREIYIYKFRTMTVTEDGAQIRQATRNDQRVTAVGRVLRRFSIDELPQLINVIKGNMSLVGPRPHAVAHNEEYRKLIKGYMVRHKVLPGITGLAQINGCRGETTQARRDARPDRIRSGVPAPLVAGTRSQDPLEYGLSGRGRPQGVLKGGIPIPAINFMAKLCLPASVIQFLPGEKRGKYYVTPYAYAV